jgi:hypothetical protein
MFLSFDCGGFCFQRCNESNPTAGIEREHTDLFRQEIKKARQQAGYFFIAGRINPA